MNNNIIFKLVFVFLVLLNLIIIPPSIASLLSITTEYRDVLLNSEKYIKKEVVIDSLEFNDLDGSDYEDVSGYSKYLNDYKTEIILGSVRDENVSQDLKMNENGNLEKYVWYRDQVNIAYEAKEEDKIFPIKEFIYKKIKILILWIISLIFIILFYRKIKTKKT
jgi:hypothetical protein